MKVVDGVVDEEGSVRFTDSVELSAGQRVLVTILDEPAESGERDITGLKGCIAYSGRPISIEEMNAAIAERASQL